MAVVNLNCSWFVSDLNAVALVEIKSSIYKVCLIWIISRVTFSYPEKKKISK